MSKTGAARIDTSTGHEWCHFSKQGEKLKLRRFVEGTAIDFDAEDSEIVESISLAECKEYVPDQKSYSIDKNPSVWCRILSKLQSGTVVPAKKASGSQIIVPLTRLRRYYTSMKVFDKALYKSLANYYRDNPTSLEALWNDSRKQFTKYSNPDGWGGGERKSLPEAKQSLCDLANTYDFISYFIKHGLADTHFRFVGNEINPWQTRLGLLSTKQPASKTGKGGIDILMRSPEGLPVVGEVKVRNDKNAFFALLQAMTYAVELSTQNQIKRLTKHFPQDFEGLSERQASVEIAVIKVNPTDDPTLEPVLSLITLMNQRNKCGGLGRVRLLQNEGEQWTTYF